MDGRFVRAAATRGSDSASYTYGFGVCCCAGLLTGSGGSVCFFGT